MNDQGQVIFAMLKRVFVSVFFLLPLCFGATARGQTVGEVINTKTGHYYVVHQSGHDWALMDDQDAIQRVARKIIIKRSLGDVLPGEGREIQSLRVYRDGELVSNAQTTQMGEIALGDAGKYFRPAKYCYVTGTRLDLMPFMENWREHGIFPVKWPKFGYEVLIPIKTATYFVETHIPADAPSNDQFRKGSDEVERWTSEEQTHLLARFNQAIARAGIDARIDASGRDTDYPVRIVAVDQKNNITEGVSTSLKFAAISLQFNVEVMRADQTKLLEVLGPVIDDMKKRDDYLKIEQILRNLEITNKAIGGSYRFELTNDAREHFEMGSPSHVRYAFEYLIDADPRTATCPIWGHGKKVGQGD